MKKIERTIHDSVMKALRSILIKYKGCTIIYLYFPKYQKGVVLSKNTEFDRWVAEPTKEIKVKGGK